MKETGRNDPCPCGSGKKYKKCCGVSKSLKQRSFQVVSSEGSSLLGRISESGKSYREQQEAKSSIQASFTPQAMPQTPPQSENSSPSKEKD